jgi:protein-S-isoprenylcysteine O-methyltransferase Ste14
MELVPDLSIGLWNAWIIMVIALCAAFLPFVFGGEVAERRMEGESESSDRPARFRVGVVVTHGILMPFTLVYSIFVPMALGTAWLYAGLIVSGLAIAMALAASIAFSTAPLDRPLTTGVYAVSRHPMYVSQAMVYAGVGLAGTSWVFLVCAVIAIVAYAGVATIEEGGMSDKYGTAYREYMQRTPRWIGLPTHSPETRAAGHKGLRHRPQQHP